MARGPEKRRKTRFQVSNIEVEYTESNLFSFLKKNTPGRQPLVDISSDGMQFLCNKRLSDGSTLKLSVLLPENAGSIEAQGEVRWTQQIPGKDLYRTGVAFTGMSQEAVAKLQALETKLGELPIRVLCNACGVPFRVPKRLEGRKVKCPKCSQVIEIRVEEPVERVAERDVHVSAPSAEQPPEGLRGLISDALYMFIKRSLRSHLHLTIIEYLAKASTGANVFTVSGIASILRKPEGEVADACRDLVAGGILAEVGRRTFNFGGSKATREAILELRRASVNQKARAAILQFILEQEKKR